MSAAVPKAAAAPVSVRPLAWVWRGGPPRPGPLSPCPPAETPARRTWSCPRCSCPQGVTQLDARGTSGRTRLSRSWCPDTARHCPVLPLSSRGPIFLLGTPDSPRRLSSQSRQKPSGGTPCDRSLRSQIIGNPAISSREAAGPPAPRWLAGHAGSRCLPTSLGCPRGGRGRRRPPGPRPGTPGTPRRGG